MSNQQKPWSDFEVNVKSAIDSLMQDILLMKADGYKIGHWRMLPAGTSNMYSYGAPRGLSDTNDEILWIGIQGIIKRFFLRPITARDVERTAKLFKRYASARAFNYEGWMDIVNRYGGYLPFTIRALPEGSVVPAKIPLYDIECSEPDKFAWLVSYFEPLTLQSWYPTTVASLAFALRKMIGEFWIETVDSENYWAIEYAMNDFGYRGASSDQSAGIGGAAFLSCFRGSDTIAALCALYDFYNLDEDDESYVPANTVYATEHTIMCSNSDAENRNDYAAFEMAVSLLEEESKAAEGNFVIVAAVIDTFNAFRAAKWIATDFFERIKATGGRFVLRPDSGNPVDVPVQIIELLMNTVGYTINSKGYKVLPSCVRVLQGDGIDYEIVKQILLKLRSLGISAENIVFGMGGGLLQAVTRDDNKFAQKASSVEINGTWVDVFKDPITDPGKTSLKGRLTVVKRSGEIICIRQEDIRETDEELMRPIFKNGKLLVDESFIVIRERVMTALKDRGLI